MRLKSELTVDFGGFSFSLEDKGVDRPLLVELSTIFFA
jgi:hypothetical protein